MAAQLPQAPLVAERAGGVPAASLLAPLLALGAALAAICVLYLDTARSIVAIWNSSETYAHGYLILPLALWLVWQRRAMLAAVPLRPYWPGLALLLACVAAWLLAVLADVQVVRQYAFVALLPIAVLVVLGRPLATAIAFPLLFLLLAVPFGDVFIAPLIDFTARFTVWALQLSGIPVLREGANLTLPSGNWSVVDACSGERYLIASFTLGCLYAYLSYRSLGRRLLFLIVAVVVPIIANGLRAYMIVMIGHLSGMTLAVGIDHIIYGWLFFGLVMWLVYAVGGRWREEPAVAASMSPSRLVGTPGGRAAGFGLAALAVALCALSGPALLALDRLDQGQAAVELDGIRPVWQAAPAFTDWQAAYATPAARWSQALADGTDRAALSVLYYRHSAPGRGAVNSENRLLQRKDPLWAAGASTTVNAAAPGATTLRVRETALRGRGGDVLVWQWYWVDGRFLANDYAAKLLQAKSALLRGNDDGAVLFAVTPLGDNLAAARAVLQRLLADNLAALEQELARKRRQGDRR